MTTAVASPSADASTLVEGLLIEGVSFNPSDPNELFELVDLLGEGSYGAVYRAQYRRDTSLPPVAIKIIPADEDLTSLKREIAILHHCHSDYVVEFKDCFFADNELWIVMEFCMGGSVADMLDATEKTLTEPQIRAICACTALGLAYLHGNHHIHRDLKAGNILLSLDGKAKLADFGVSAQLSSTVKKRITVVGTPFWMAPEVIQEISYDGKADVWSLAITAIEMAEGAPPHYNVHPMRAIFLIPSKPPPRLSKGSGGKADWSPEFHDFLARCLVKDPAKRVDSHTLLSHPFIAADVQRLQRNPDAGLEPIKGLVTSALDFLARYRAGSTTTTTTAAAAEDADGIMRLPSLNPALLATAAMGATVAAEEEEGASGRQHRQRESGGGGGWPRQHHRPSVSGGQGGEVVGVGPLLATHTQPRSRVGSVAEVLSPSGTMIRTQVAGAHQEQQQHRGSLSRRTSLDVSHSGTMVRTTTQQQAQPPRPLSSSGQQAGSSGLQSALRYLHGLGMSRSGSSGGHSPSTSSSSSSPCKQGSSPGRNKPTAAGGEGELMTIADRLSTSLSASYHERKRRERKAATVEEVQGLLQALGAQYQRDRLALEGAYLAERRELEEALHVVQQQQQQCKS